MNYHVAKTIGLNTDQKASQVIYSFCDDDNLFLAVLTLEGDDAFITGRQLLSDLSTSFCEKEGSAGEKLTEAFQEAKKTLEGKKFSLLLATISTKVLYLIGNGPVSAILKREDNLSTLLQEGSEQLISGFLKEGDKVFLATESLNSFLGDNLAASFRLPLPEWEDEMAIRLNEEGVESGSLAGLLVEVEQPISEGAPAVSSAENYSDDNLVPIGVEEESSESPGTSPLARAAVIFQKLISRLLSSLPKSGRVRLILALVIILVIIVGLAIKFITAKNEQKTQQLSYLLQQAQTAKNEAEGLKTLNPQAASQKLAEANSLVAQALKIKSNSKEAQDLKKQLEEASGAILQKFSASELAEFIDLSSAQANFKGDKLSLVGQTLTALDSQAGNLLTLSLTSQGPKTLAKKEDLGKAREISAANEAIFTYSSDKGILKTDTSNKKTTQVIKSDSDWGQIEALANFSGNLYLLDSGKNQVWKYLPTTNTYSSKRNYLTSKADLTGATDMEIDSSVYILKQNGDILKFTKGAKDDFSLTALDKPLKDPKALFVSSGTESLYVLDSGNSRVVAFTKGGQYKAQYQQDKLAVVADFIVDEPGKKIYLLDGSKIYTMDLK